jgi:hypothetical protein
MDNIKVTFREVVCEYERRMEVILVILALNHRLLPP